MEDLSDACKPMIMEAEQFKQFAYKDTTGHLTIGYGRNLDAKGVSRAVADMMLAEDIQEAIYGCRSHLKFFEALDQPRQTVLVNLAFNMGMGGLMSFEKMLSYLEHGKYTDAANELRNSLENKEVPNRIFPLIKILETGHVV